ncbi:hypothetical protein BS47DRAFT_1347817, partial [Hydnum rufescens UP504]
MSFHRTVRASQAEHNVNWDGSIPDPPLTPLGKQQAEDLNERTSDNIQATADLLVTSPLTRTTPNYSDRAPEAQVAPGSRRPETDCLSRLQAKGASPCDIGKSREGIDFSSLEDDWNVKVGDFAPENVVSRAKWLRKWLRARPEREIVVVSHATFLVVITNTDRFVNWGPGEIRSFTFVEDDDEDA